MAEDQLVRAIQAASYQEESKVGFDSEEQIARLASKQLDDSDLEVVRSSLSLLSEIKDAASKPEDMEGEVPTEITQACILSRQEMSKIIEAKSLYSVTEQQEDETMVQIAIYLEIIDLVDLCLREYKERYV